MDGLPCMIYSGMGGFVMMCLVASITLVAFISYYAYCRWVVRSERRPPNVFGFDLSKIIIASVVASAVNYVFTAKLAQAALDLRVRGKPLEGVGWYAAVSCMDVLLGVPVSIGVGRLVNRISIFMLRHVPVNSVWWDVFHQNTQYGQYSDTHRASEWYRTESPELHWSWWYSQTVTWSCANMLGTIISGGLLLLGFSALPSVLNPITWIAAFVTFWNVGCLAKQWAVVVVGRISMQYLHWMLVDHFNQFRTRDTPVKGDWIDGR